MNDNIYIHNNFDFLFNAIAENPNSEICVSENIEDFIFANINFSELVSELLSEQQHINQE